MAFEALYRATYPRVLAYARSLATPQDADDAVAETYAIAWRRQRDVPRGAELGWLIGVARRVLANTGGGTGARALYTRCSTSSPRVTGPDPAEQVVDSELRAALLALSPPPSPRTRSTPSCSTAYARSPSRHDEPSGGPWRSRSEAASRPRQRPSWCWQAARGGPSRADAVTQALHWLSPPAGTILHTRSVATQGGHTTTTEMWQSADDPATERLRHGGNPTYETAGDAVYDPATDTIYAAPADPTSPADDAKLAAGRVGAKTGTLGPGDPIVDKVRTLLQDHRMTVGAETTHDGAAALPISLKAGPGGRSGRSGSPPPAAGRSSCATPAAMRTRRPRTSAGRSTKCCRAPTRTRCSPSPAHTPLPVSSATPRASRLPCRN